ARRPAAAALRPGPGAHLRLRGLRFANSVELQQIAVRSAPDWSGAVGDDRLLHGSSVGAGFSRPAKAGPHTLGARSDLANDPHLRGRLRISLAGSQSRRQRADLAHPPPHRSRFPGSGGAARGTAALRVLATGPHAPRAESPL